MRACAQAAVCEEFEEELRKLRAPSPRDADAIAATAARHAAAAKAMMLPRGYYWLSRYYELF